MIIISQSYSEDENWYYIQGKFCPRFILALFALWPEGEFKTVLIDFYVKDCVTNLGHGRIQDLANQFQISVGRK